MEDFYYEYENLLDQGGPEYYDDVGDYAEYYDYIVKRANPNIETAKEVYLNCAVPSTIQTIKFLTILFSCNLTYSLLVLFGRKLWPHNQISSHLFSVICGITALQYITSYKWLIVLCVSCTTYALIFAMVYVKAKRIGVGVTIFVICTQLLLETFLKNTINWHNLRGCQMIVAMKMISFAFDIQVENNKHERIGKLPNLLCYLGYILSPKTCVLGPWIPYRMYLQTHNLLLKRKLWLLPVVINFIAAIVFVNLSNCLIPWWRSIFKEWLCIAIYLEALAVRCSHYFTSFSSQSIIAVGGFVPEYEMNPLGYQVVKPMAIELPRSLTHLVRNWNIPMHKWLKNYIFHKMKSACGSYVLSLIFTYTISALIHGFHFEVHLVLISLSVFTYVENLLRNKLAYAFNACISTSCYKMKCPYAYCPRKCPWSINSLLVRLTNFFFSILTVINLAYIGVILNEIMDMDNNNMERYNGAEKWYHLNFFGHWIHVVMYIVNLFIRLFVK